MVDNPRPAHERQTAFVTLYYKGNEEVRDKDNNIVVAAQAAGPYEMFPIDAKQAIARDPENWSYDPHADQPENDPGDESRQSAHGNTPEEIEANDAGTSMRKAGFAAEPAGSRAGRRPGAYRPDRLRNAPSPVTLVDPAKDRTQGPGNEPKGGDTGTAANRSRRGGAPAAADDQTLG